MTNKREPKGAGPVYPAPRQDVDKVNRLPTAEKGCKARLQACKKGSLPRRK